jgi:hypothetical protein
LNAAGARSQIIPVTDAASRLPLAEREIERTEARCKKLIEMVMEGVAPSVVKDELTRIHWPWR